MRLRYTSGLTAASLGMALAYTWLVMLPGLAIPASPTERIDWIGANLNLWMIGWWLWMAAIFGWMVMLVTLSWSYLPAHRVASALQAGLTIIAAACLIAAAVVWMNISPWTVSLENGEDWLAFADRLALGFMGAGLLMGGLATAWINYDLIQAGLAQPYLWFPLLAAGLFAAPAPFFLPDTLLPIIGALAWIGGNLWLLAQRGYPLAYSEWK
jgi:hypothetical protein